MSRVYISRAEYSYGTVRQTIFGMMDSIGGDLIRDSSRVVVKPNLLAPASPDEALLTHPMVVKAAVEYVLQKGGVVQVSDSPAMGGFEKILEASGIKEALAGLDVEMSEFKTTATVDIGEPFNSIEIAEAVINADIVINLPKLKTHSQMLLTLGVKNLFGCIVGLRKPEWHFRTGVDREMFARLLVKIFLAIKPSFTIIDGITAMEGEGPGKSGTPRELGVLMGSSDAISLDIAVCRMLGVEPGKLLTNRVAGETGFPEEEVMLIGSPPEINDFRLPEITPLIFGPKPLHALMRKHLVQRPVADDKTCRLCGECWKYCPADAIDGEGRRLRFDYEKCIRCYCCIEVCPHAALEAKETLTGKALKRVIRRG